MAAIIELTKQERAGLVKRLNNLNLGFVYSGFGEAFVAMLDGAPLTLDARKKNELEHLINNLNLGMYHARVGTFLVNLMDAPSAAATAAAISEGELTSLARLLNDLNLGLAKLSLGDKVHQAAIALAPPPQVPDAVTSVTVAPATVASLDDNKTKKFTATVTVTGNASQDVEWSASPTANGSIDDTGLFTPKAGATGVTTITATSKADNTQTGTATITTIKSTATATPPPANKDFKVVNGTATAAAGAVALTAADGAKTLTVSAADDSEVAGAKAELVTAADSAKLAVALAGKTLTLTPVAGQTGAVPVKISAAGYNDLTLTINLS